MIVKVVSVPELASKSGKTACALAEESETQGMLQVILEEKKEFKAKEPENEGVEEEVSAVRTSPREKRPSVLPRDFVDPDQVRKWKECLCCFVAYWYSGSLFH